MKTFYSIIIIFFMTLSCHGQTWKWAKSVNGNDEEGFSTCTDKNGNVFLAGEFDGQMIAGTYTVNGAGTSNHAFIIKYDSTGNVLWANISVGALGESARAVTCDSLGNSYLAGILSSSVATFGTFTLTNLGTNNLFLVKYDASGNVVWAKTSSNSRCQAFSASSDDIGNVYVSGFFSGTIGTFGTYTISNAVPANDNFFLAKYNSSGNVLWVRNSYSDGYGTSVSTEKSVNGNIFVNGYIYTPSITFGTYTLTNSGSLNVFIVKYDSNGNLLWAKSPSMSSGYSNSGAVCADNMGNVYFSGQYGSSPITFGTYTLSGGPGSNFFLTKYDTNGNPAWAKTSLTSTASSFPGGWSSVTVDANRIFVSGAMDPGGNSLVLGTYTLSPPVGYYDPAFIALYDNNGNVMYADALSSGGDDWLPVSFDKFCNVYLGGDFMVTPFTLGTNSLSQTAGGENGFVAKLSFACQPLGINETLDEFFKINVYPNPNNGSFKIQIDNQIDNGEIILINSLGQKIHQQKIYQGQNNIITYGLASGLYNYILLQDKGQISNGKLTVE